MIRQLDRSREQQQHKDWALINQKIAAFIHANRAVAAFDNIVRFHGSPSPEQQQQLRREFAALIAERNRIRGRRKE